VVSVTRLRVRLFGRGIPPATGTLHVAGDRGGDESTFSLSQPRYSASHHSVSYAAKPLNHRSLPSRGARAAQSGAPPQFGAASLSIVGAPQVAVGDYSGLDCSTTLTNNTSHWLGAAAEPNWPTDTWNPGIGFQATLEPLNYGTITFVSDGGFFAAARAGRSGYSLPVPKEMTRIRPWCRLPRP